MNTSPAPSPAPQPDIAAEAAVRLLKHLLTCQTCGQKFSREGRYNNHLIVHTLTETPRYIPEWEEYAALGLNGLPVYGQTWSKCFQAKTEADEAWAKHQQGERGLVVVASASA